MIKIKKFEVFGINGVGKSHSEGVLRNILNLKRINTISRRQAIVFHSHNVIELSLLDKITLTYFKLIKKIIKK